ncbi:MFS transporter [Brevibacterium sp. CFH 10365]|uniref:MFS transporter n=1 Tax=Brevibacterium sp. CFH 10365 TaxID=2585207 RepID=UPI0012664696|nr:MFS transporter [Brevibacterium sp. CFH 10365]
MSETPADPPATKPPSSIAAAAFVSSFDRFAVSPLLVLIATDLGASLTQSLAVASLYYLAYGFSQPVWGVLSDRFGRVRLMRLTLIAAAIAGLASALAPGLITLIIARAFAGAFYGAIVPTSLTYVGDTVAEKHRQPALADLMAAIAIGTALATAASGLIADWLDWRIVFAVPAVLAVVCCFGLNGLRETRSDGGGMLRTLWSAISHRWVLLVVGLAFVEGAAVLGVLTLMAPALQAQGVGAGPAGLATAAYGLGVIVTSRMVRFLSTRLTMPRLMALGGSTTVIGYAVVAVHVSIPTVFIAAALLGATWSFLHSSLQTWSTSVLPQARGTVVSLFAGCLFGGSALGAAAGGAVGAAAQWTVLFASTAAVMLVLTVITVLSRRAYERRSG